MNAKSQMKAWAVDQVSKLCRESGLKIKDLADATKMADELVAYAYCPDLDFNDSIQRLVSILKESPDALDKVEQLILELNMMKEEIERQLDTRKAALQ